jgi:uncharacterized repeat protein (TIGR01451 family)
MHVTVHTGGPTRVFEAPVEVGLRPGYIYRVALSDLPDLPGVTLFPTLEVIGTLQLPPQIRAANYPVPIRFTLEDILHARAGGYVKKVIYLECPEQAPALATSADHALETELLPGRDLLEEARELGRPLLIVRLGGRSFPPAELTAAAVPGTVLLPNEKALGAPAAPPHVPWACWPVYDPSLGPKAATEECLRDGGDHGIPAAIDGNGNLLGIEPADTVAGYKDSKGELHVAISNAVCICVPRFAVLRSTVIPAGYAVAIRPTGTQMAERERVLKARTPSLQARETVALESVQSRQRSSSVQGRQGLIDVSQSEGLTTISGRMKEKSVTGTMIEKTPAPPDRPLILCKSADKQAAQIGDIVTFTLRYTNRGGQPISDIVIVDSLTGRLEYISASSQSDRPAVITMQENEAGSLLLRWQINMPLPPGQTGTVRFQARVR